MASSTTLNDALPPQSAIASVPATLNNTLLLIASVRAANVLSCVVNAPVSEERVVASACIAAALVDNPAVVDAANVLVVVLNCDSAVAARLASAKIALARTVASLFTALAEAVDKLAIAARAVD